MLRLEIVLTGIDVSFAFIQYLFIPQVSTDDLTCMWVSLLFYLGLLVLKKFKLL